MKSLRTFVKFNENLSNQKLQQFREDEVFILQTFLDLQYDGYRVRVADDVIAKSFLITEPMPGFVIQRQRTGYSSPYFKLSDVKHELLQIKSYLDDRWFKCGVVFVGDPERIEVEIDEEDYDLLGEQEIVNLVVFFNI